jgi:hypothetical protein
LKAAVATQRRGRGSDCRCWPCSFEDLSASAVDPYPADGLTLELTASCPATAIRLISRAAVGPVCREVPRRHREDGATRTLAGTVRCEGGLRITINSMTSTAGVPGPRPSTT